MNQLLFYCRPGFEKEMAAEIQDKAVKLECFGFARIVEQSGYVLFECYSSEDADKLARRLPFRELIFARQMIVVTHEVAANSVKRIKIPNVCAGLGLRFMTPYEMLRVEKAKFVLGGGKP